MGGSTGGACIESTLYLATQHARSSCALFTGDIDIDRLFFGNDQRMGIAGSPLGSGHSLVWKDVGLKERDRMAETCDLLGRIDAGEAESS